MSIEIAHGCARGGEPFIPQICVLREVCEETSDVKTFTVTTREGTKPFDCEPGQLGMLGILEAGEAMFCVSGQTDDAVQFTVKRVGEVTEKLHTLMPGAEVTVRGPYGNAFPAQSCKGRDMLFVAGGIGLAPVAAFMRYTLEHRADYGRIDLVYSASTKADLVFKHDLFEAWPGMDDTHVHVSVYRESEDWTGEVSYTAPFLETLDLGPNGNRAVTLCGGPSLFRTCSKSLLDMGYAPGDIITTLEMRMKCGVGKCGRCNIGGKFICLDGPVFTMEELSAIQSDV